MGPSVLSGPRRYLRRAMGLPVTGLYQRDCFVCQHKGVEGLELGETHRSIVCGVEQKQPLGIRLENPTPTSA